jgi:hypothetical protein
VVIWQTYQCLLPFESSSPLTPSWFHSRLCVTFLPHSYPLTTLINPLLTPCHPLSLMDLSCLCAIPSLWPVTIMVYCLAHFFTHLSCAYVSFTFILPSWALYTMFLLNILWYLAYSWSLVHSVVFYDVLLLSLWFYAVCWPSYDFISDWYLLERSPAFSWTLCYSSVFFSSL